MCGIFGIVSTTRQNVCEKIIQGLIQLQNRGYDSSGLSVLDVSTGELVVHKYASTKSENSLDKLQRLSLFETPTAYLGIGHNRWATHGIKNDINAHPHLSNNKQFAIVHNGIIENYMELKHMLIKEGFVFVSQTDSEIIVNLISFYYNKCRDTQTSIQLTINDLQGTYGIIVLDSKSPDQIYCVRNGSPLLVGKNDDCIIITSEQSGFCNLISNYITLQNDDICIIERSCLSMKTTNAYTKNKVSFTNQELTPHPFQHWTLKEIHYQPGVILNAINNGGRIACPRQVKLGGLEQHLSILKDINNIIILGCGTSYFASLYGMYFFKRLCNLNTIQVFDGADFSEYDIPKTGKTTMILVSQSGETKDLHRCIEIAEKNNIITIGVINVVDSLIAREVDCGVYCNAGVEVGVASTKAFTSQVVCLSMVAIWFSQIHDINEHLRIKMISDLQNLSNDFKNTIENVDKQVQELARTIFRETTNMFILGKGSDEYIAKEGSLKVKEISYIHCEGYSASSLKHGPFALLDENFPVIILNLDNKHKTKIESCMEEVMSRNSPVLLISNDGQSSGINVSSNLSYSSLLGIIPIQLLAYYLSINREINPDKPKNLAKVVTVE
jgi:glucosamine--fructose-6-phosphate aminotransferase (isomerizing)